MKRSLFGISGVCAALTLVSAAYGQTPSVSETIPLRYLDARAVSAEVKAEDGIEQITVDLRKNSVTVRGSRASVAAFKTEMQKTDLFPALHAIIMRLVRYEVDSQGKVSESLQSVSAVSATDGKPSMMSMLHDLSGYLITVTPTQSTDKTVTLAVEVREQGGEGEILQSGKNTRSVKRGQPVRVTGMTTSPDKALQRAAQHGEIVTNRGIAYTGYYLEVQSTVQSETMPPLLSAP